MPKQMRYVVRVITDATNATWFDNPFLECLRYAGLVKVHESTVSTNTMCFDILPPEGTSTGTEGSEAEQRWAEMNAASMRSFGINAVVAPRA